MSHRLDFFPDGGSSPQRRGCSPPAPSEAFPADRLRPSPKIYYSELAYPTWRRRLGLAFLFVFFFCYDLLSVLKVKFCIICIHFQNITHESPKAYACCLSCSISSRICLLCDWIACLTAAEYFPRRHFPPSGDPAFRTSAVYLFCHQFYSSLTSCFVSHFAIDDLVMKQLFLNSSLKKFSGSQSFCDICSRSEESFFVWSQIEVSFSRYKISSVSSLFDTRDVPISLVGEGFLRGLRRTKNYRRL